MHIEKNNRDMRFGQTSPSRNIRTAAQTARALHIKRDALACGCWNTRKRGGLPPDSLKGVRLMDELIQFTGLLIVLVLVLYMTR